MSGFGSSAAPVKHFLVPVFNDSSIIIISLGSAPNPAAKFKYKALSSMSKSTAFIALSRVSTSNQHTTFNPPLVVLPWKFLSTAPQHSAASTRSSKLVHRALPRLCIMIVHKALPRLCIERFDVSAQPDIVVHTSILAHIIRLAGTARGARSWNHRLVPLNLERQGIYRFTHTHTGTWLP